jgi:hypothetical protein
VQETVAASKHFHNLVRRPWSPEFNGVGFPSSEQAESSREKAKLLLFRAEPSYKSTATKGNENNQVIADHQNPAMMTMVQKPILILVITNILLPQNFQRKIASLLDKVIYLSFKRKDTGIFLGKWYK